MPSKPTIPVVCEGCGGTFFTWPYKLRMGEGKVCNRACQAIRDQRLEPERFWANVDRSGPVPSHRPDLGMCWLHTKKPNTDGYIVVRFEGRRRPAHVVSLILTNDEPIEDIFVCHHCDIRACVRPSHLFLGDHLANMADMTTKGRAATGDRNAARLYPERKERGDAHWSRRRPDAVSRGARHSNAKLTEAVVIEARARHAGGGVTLQVLADWAGVSKAVMHRIIRRKAWAHVT